MLKQPSLLTLYLIAVLIPTTLSTVSCSRNQTSNFLQPINDPFERVNRNTHEFNKKIDTLAIKPVSSLYGATVPQIIRLGADNFYNNLQEPKRLANHLFQGEFINASIDLGRFGLNSTMGVAGVFDPASYINLFSSETDFDHTFAYFSIPTGPYIELPLLGPSSIRGSIGLIADYTFNPLTLASGPVQQISLLTLEAINILNKRFEYSAIFDSLLYESSDSYSSNRRTYLERRNYTKSTNDEINHNLFDPLAEF